MKPVSLYKVLLFSALLGSVFSIACGSSRSTPVAVTGNWLWTENTPGSGLTALFHVSLNQTLGTVAGTKILPGGTTCAITGTLTGRQLQATASDGADDRAAVGQQSRHDEVSAVGQCSANP